MSDKMLLVEQYFKPLQVVKDSAPRPGVLCTLFGVLSDFGRATRNHRWYTLKLWKKVLDSDNFKEQINYNTQFGEPDHPLEIEDRVETHLPNVSHIIRDVFIDEADQTVKGYLDILDTPYGRIIKTLVDYGCILGVSSRGSGDLVSRNGEDYVDEDTYQFITWDIVARPSNTRARVNPTERSKAYESLKVEIDKLTESKDYNGLRTAKVLIESSQLLGKDTLFKRINEALELEVPDNSEEIETRIDDGRGLVASESSVIMNIKKDLDAAYLRIATLKTQNKELDSENKELKVTVSECQNTISELQQVNSNLEKILSSKIISLSNNDNTNDRSTKKNNKFITDCFDSLVSKIDELSENLGFKLDSLNEKYEDVSDTSKVTMNNVELSSQVEELKDELRNANTKADEYKEEVDKVKSECDKVMEKYISLRCSQLGLNEKLVIKQVGRTTSVDYVDEVINESYSSVSSNDRSSRLNESRNNTGIMLGKLSIDKSKVLEESMNKRNDGDISISDLSSIIRSTRKN